MIPGRPKNRPVPVDVCDDGARIRIGYASNEYTRDVFRAIWYKCKGES